MDIESVATLEGGGVPVGALESADDSRDAHDVDVAADGLQPCARSDEEAARQCERIAAGHTVLYESVVVSQQPNNFIKDCKWSPPGDAIATSDDGNVLRLFALPTEAQRDEADDSSGGPSGPPAVLGLAPWLQLDKGARIHDFVWHPSFDWQVGARRRASVCY
eukprot:GHVU01013609.1.p2 GENE.GHVU01013609.1~~GHVU01013609.1.p2  ORF type:complete len:163 (+),score=30.46 GHVU01013609.1:163-651(+)